MNVDQSVMNVTNYLVPAAGQTHAVKFSGVLSAAPYAIDWRQFRIDQFPFQPQGVFIDNSAGTDALTITINPIGFAIVCPAGARLNTQFPAPNGQTCTITGNGQATVIFVDFPVLPESLAAGAGGGPQSVSLDAITTAQVLNVQMSPLAQGAVPYQVINYPVPAPTPLFGSSATTITLAPPANANLRKLIIDIPGGASNASGVCTVIAKLNGVNVFTRNVTVPKVVGSEFSSYHQELDFDNIGFNAGAGNFQLSVAPDFVTGGIEVNAYFTP